MPIDGQLMILFNTILAALFGGIIGLEREISKKPAGLRTHMLISASSFLLVALGGVLVESFQNSPSIDFVRTDPVRIIEAIIVGVSFIGGGIIIQNKEKGAVRNLTTAASVLFSATIGICVALKLYYLAGGISLFSLTVNYAIYQLEKMLPKKSED